MKILLLCGGRVGSYYIAEWLAEELNLLFALELDNSVDYKIKDNVILKRTLSNNNFDINDISYFDKIILLYRNNTLKQAESNVHAILNNTWHHTSKTKTDTYYTIDEKFLIEHHNMIWETKRNIDKDVAEMLKINFGLKISYEEIFEDGVGQKMIEEYIGFQSKVLIDNKLKLRKDDDKYHLMSYQREINELTSKIELLKKESYEIKKNNDKLNSIVKELKNENASLKKDTKYKLI